MKEIKLTKGMIALVDDADYKWLSQWRWNEISSHEGRHIAAKRTEWPGRKTIYMHREILGLTDPKVFCDHIDGNPLNNQRHNLRACDMGQNARNSRPQYTKSFKGISWNKKNKKWVVRITVNNKCIYLGYRSTLVDAKLTYNEAAIKYHGEFAWLNPITD